MSRRRSPARGAPPNTMGQHLWITAAGSWMYCPDYFLHFISNILAKAGSLLKQIIVPSASDALIRVVHTRSDEADTRDNARHGYSTYARIERVDTNKHIQRKWEASEPLKSRTSTMSSTVYIKNHGKARKIKWTSMQSATNQKDEEKWLLLQGTCIGRLEFKLGQMFYKFCQYFTIFRMDNQVRWTHQNIYLNSIFRINDRFIQHRKEPVPGSRKWKTSDLPHVDERQNQT